MINKIEVIVSKRGYVVTEDGQLLNPKGKIIGNIDSTGRETSQIRIEGKKKLFKTHRLQAYQKYGKSLYEEGIVVRHLDGNPSNNSWDNIAIGTQSDNMMDIPEQIRIKKAKHASSFIRKYDSDEVKKFYDKNRSYKETMKKFNISSKGTLHYILNNSNS